MHGTKSQGNGLLSVLSDSQSAYFSCPQLEKRAVVFLVGLV